MEIHFYSNSSIKNGKSSVKIDLSCSVFKNQKSSDCVFSYLAVYFKLYKTDE